MKMFIIVAVYLTADHRMVGSMDTVLKSPVPNDVCLQVASEFHERIVAEGKRRYGQWGVTGAQVQCLEVGDPIKP